ncbi:hypothetical protein [Aurantivibrio infirmus]
MNDLIQKLLKARRNQLALFDEKPDWHRELGRIYVNSVNYQDTHV